MPTHFKGSRKEITALNAFIKFMRASGRISAHMDRFIATNDLTEGQFGVLEALFHLGDMCQKALGEKMFSTRGNITLIVDNLEKRDLVERVRDESDRRFITVHLTEKGRSLIENIFPEHAAHIERTLSVLTEDEQEELGRLCKKLGTSQLPEFNAEEKVLARS